MSNHDEKAFPSTVQYFPEDTNYHLQQGMTLRDYFAAKAMAAFIGNNKTGLIDMPRMAEGAYKMADFMLRAREA